MVGRVVGALPCLRWDPDSAGGRVLRWSGGRWEYGKRLGRSVGGVISRSGALSRGVSPRRMRDEMVIWPSITLAGRKALMSGPDRDAVVVMFAAGGLRSARWTRRLSRGSRGLE